MQTESARERFANWVAWLGTQYDAARFLGTDQGSVSSWVNGRRKPGLRMALRIEQCTLRWPGGPIGANEWTEDARG